MKLSPILLLLGCVGPGYLPMVLGITLAQDAFFGGVSYTFSSLPVLAVAGAGTFAAAVVGGWVGSRISGLPVNLVQIVLVSLETNWLIRNHKTPGPVWFDVLAGLSLVIGLALGGWLQRRATPSAQRSSVTSSPTST